MDREDKGSIIASPGEVLKHEYEYRCCGVCNIFLTSESLVRKTHGKITERRTKLDWAWFIEEMADQYESAEKIKLVINNLNTHNPG